MRSHARPTRPYPGDPSRPYRGLHARPSRTVRLDGLWIGVFLVFVSAAVTTAVLWFLLSAFLGMTEYRVEQVLR